MNQTSCNLNFKASTYFQAPKEPPNLDQVTICRTQIKSVYQETTFENNISAPASSTQKPDLEYLSSTIGRNVVQRTLLPSGKALSMLLRYLKWQRVIIIYDNDTCK